MYGSANSLLISAGILLVLALADPCVESIATMLRRSVLRQPAPSDPILATLMEPQTAPGKERKAA